MNSFAVVIPARYKSTRLPGKPLADIHGKPMVQRVWERCVEAVGAENVYVATDDERIRKACTGFGGQVVMTSHECLTGTDRLAEANRQLKRDMIINVQGDEPMIDPQAILAVKSALLAEPDNVINAYAEISAEENASSYTVPKVVMSKTSRLLYISRSLIPMGKNGGHGITNKQVCIYGFSQEHLNFFSQNPRKTDLEAVEDIEILRFIENDYTIKMVKVENTGIAVDTPEDLEKVRNLLK